MWNTLSVDGIASVSISSLGFGLDTCGFLGVLEGVGRGNSVVGVSNLSNGLGAGGRSMSIDVVDGPAEDSAKVNLLILRLAGDGAFLVVTPLAWELLELARDFVASCFEKAGGRLAEPVCETVTASGSGEERDISLSLGGDLA